jgi:hypothetical protein
MRNFWAIDYRRALRPGFSFPRDKQQRGRQIGIKKAHAKRREQKIAEACAVDFSKPYPAGKGA